MQSEKFPIAICNLQFAIFLVAFLAGLAFAQEEAQKAPSPPQSKISYDRVADLLGLDKKLVNQTLTELAQKKVGQRHAITFLVVARDRMLRLLRTGAIERDEKEKIFHETINVLAEKYQEGGGTGWQNTLEEYGLLIPDVMRRAGTIMQQARVADKASKPVRSLGKSEFPEHLSKSLVERLSVKEELLKELWGGGLNGVYLKNALMLLLLAKERTNQLVHSGSAAEAEREKSFAASLNFFLGQLRQGMGWGDLAVQVGRHGNDLIREADTILKGRQYKRPEDS